MIPTLMNKTLTMFTPLRQDRRPTLRALGTALALIGAGLMLPSIALAHDYRVGKVSVEHPYAPPSVNAASTAAVYLRRIDNSGDQTDRLIAARTPVARAVEFHSMSIDAANVMQMRAQPRIEIPAGGKLELRPGGPLHLMLLDLKRPLKEGNRFPLTLVFERSGEVAVMVWVQVPRKGSAEEPSRHAH
jgi:periplasmic copper chaperone A